VVVNALERLGSHVVGGRLSDGARAAVTLHVVDTVAAWVAATRTPEGKALIRFRAGNRPRGPGGPESCALDVMTHCALARLSEIDDIHLASMTTPGGVVVPAALTIAATLSKTDAAAFAEAVVAGYEAMIRLGLALNGPTMLHRGIWPSYFAAPFGIAAVAARLLRFDERQAAHALAHALTLAAPGVGHHNAATTSRWFSIGLAARNGLTAALAAQAGFTSDLKIIDGVFFPGVYNVTADMAALDGGLGERDMLAEVSFKPWCAARQTMAATQAIREIMDAGVDAADVAAIEVALLPPHQKMIDHGVWAGDRASHLTSVRYQMAVAAVAPDDAFDVGQSPAALSEAVRAFMRKIEVVADHTLLSDYPCVWPARVRVRAGAREDERHVTHVPGDPGRPYDAAQVRAKFGRFVAPVMGDDGADTLYRASAAVLADSPVSLLGEIERIYAQAVAGA